MTRLALLLLALLSGCAPAPSADNQRMWLLVPGKTGYRIGESLWVFTLHDSEGTNAALRKHVAPCELLAQARALTTAQWEENALLIHRLTVATGESTAAGYFEGGYPYTHTTDSLRAFQARLDAYARACGCEVRIGDRLVMTPEYASLAPCDTCAWADDYRRAAAP